MANIGFCEFCMTDGVVVTGASEFHGGYCLECCRLARDAENEAIRDIKAFRKPKRNAAPKGDTNE